MSIQENMKERESTLSDNLLAASEYYENSMDLGEALSHEAVNLATPAAPAASSFQTTSHFPQHSKKTPYTTGAGPNRGQKRARDDSDESENAKPSEAADDAESSIEVPPRRTKRVRVMEKFALRNTLSYRPPARKDEDGQEW